MWKLKYELHSFHLRYFAISQTTTWSYNLVVGPRTLVLRGSILHCYVYFVSISGAITKPDSWCNSFGKFLLPWRDLGIPRFQIHLDLVKVCSTVGLISTNPKLVLLCISSDHSQVWTLFYIFNHLGITCHWFTYETVVLSQRIDLPSTYFAQNQRKLT